MQFSVVICSYNKLESIAIVAEEVRQQLPDGELILSDDFSSDGTPEWAKKSGLFDKIVLQRGDDGYCLNTIRNHGVEAAKMQHVVLLDADCLPQKGYFDGHRFVFQTFGNCVSVGVTHQYDKLGKNMLLQDWRESSLKGKQSVDVGWRGSFGGNIAFPKSIWESVNGFDEGFNGAWGYEDLDFALRVQNLGIALKLSGQSVVRHLAHPLNAKAQASNLYNRNHRVFCDKHGFPPF